MPTRVLREIRSGEEVIQLMIRLGLLAFLLYSIGAKALAGMRTHGVGFLIGSTWDVGRQQFGILPHIWGTLYSSLLALTMVILGGMGNVLGAILGAVALVGLPELFRVTAEYRILIYGIALLLLIRFRPQGLLGAV